MSSKIPLALILTSLFLYTKGADVNIILPPVDILRLKFQLNHIKTPDLVMNLLSNLEYKNFTSETIYLKDMFELVDDTNIVIQNYVENLILSKPFANGTIETAFKLLNISVIDIYKDLFSNFNDNIVNRAIVGLVLEQIGLTPELISNIIAYDNPATKETNFFKLLNNGNFTNIINALQLANMTLTNLSDIIAVHFGEISMDQILILGRNNANNLISNIKTFLDELPMISEKFIKNEPFATILANYTKKANEDEILATPYDSSNFITLFKPLMQYSSLTIIGELFKGNNSINITNLNSSYNHTDFLYLSSPGLNNSYANISRSLLTLPNNCSIPILKDKKLTWIEAKNLLISGKYLNASLGNESISIAAPLICNNTIYGLATSENSNGVWQFLLFHTPTPPTETTPQTTEATSQTTEAIKQTTASFNTTTDSVTTTSNSQILMGSIFNFVIICLVSFLF